MNIIRGLMNDSPLLIREASPYGFSFRQRFLRLTIIMTTAISPIIAYCQSEDIIGKYIGAHTNNSYINCGDMPDTSQFTFSHCHNPVKNTRNLDRTKISQCMREGAIAWTAESIKTNKCAVGNLFRNKSFYVRYHASGRDSMIFTSLVYDSNRKAMTYLEYDDLGCYSNCTTMEVFACKNPWLRRVKKSHFPEYLELTCGATANNQSTLGLSSLDMIHDSYFNE